jgi:hypothetical protein
MHSVHEGQIFAAGLEACCGADALSKMAKKEINTFGDAEEEAKTNPWWEEVVEECHRKLRLRKINEFVPDVHKVVVVEAMLEQLNISDEKLGVASGNPVFEEAKSIFQNLNRGDAFPDRIYELAELRIPETVARVNWHASNLFPLITNPELRNEIEGIWANEAARFPSIGNLTEKYKINELDQRYILRSLEYLFSVRRMVRNFREPFMVNEYFDVKVEGDQRDKAEYMAYRVFDPLWDFYLERHEPGYVSFPLKWAGFLSTSVVKNLYERHKAGKNVLAGLLPYFKDSKNLDKLNNAISSCPITIHHSELFEELIQSFRNSQFKVCSLASLALIEGLIWTFAIWWNVDNGPIVDRTITPEKFKNGRFNLINRHGNEMKTSPTIGLLLRNTSFGDEFSLEIVEYFCQELFTERNPVLHGREPYYGSGTKAAVLLFVIQALERQITDAFKEYYSQSLVDHVERLEKAKASAS